MECSCEFIKVPHEAGSRLPVSKFMILKQTSVSKMASHIDEGQLQRLSEAVRDSSSRKNAYS